MRKMLNGNKPSGEDSSELSSASDGAEVDSLELSPEPDSEPDPDTELVSKSAKGNAKNLSQGDGRAETKLILIGCLPRKRNSAFSRSKYKS